MKYTDTQLLDWIAKGGYGHVIDNIQTVEWQLNNWTSDIREAVARCIDADKEDKNEH
jgi:hypothetical protein